MCCKMLCCRRFFFGELEMVEGLLEEIKWCAVHRNPISCKRGNESAYNRPCDVETFNTQLQIPPKRGISVVPGKYLLGKITSTNACHHQTICIIQLPVHVFYLGKKALNICTKCVMRIRIRLLFPLALQSKFYIVCTFVLLFAFCLFSAQKALNWCWGWLFQVCCWSVPVFIYILHMRTSAAMFSRRKTTEKVTYATHCISFSNLNVAEALIFIKNFTCKWSGRQIVYNNRGLQQLKLEKSFHFH